MRHTIVILLSTVFILAFSSGTALASSTLIDTLDFNFGQGDYHEITNINTYEFNPVQGATAVLVSYLDSGGDSTALYDISPQHKEITELFNKPYDQVGEKVNFDSSMGFGIYINSLFGGYLYSNPALNPDKHDSPKYGKHARCFMIDSGSDKGAYILAFEDTANSYGSSWNYQNVVIELKGVSLSNTQHSPRASFTSNVMNGNAPVSVMFTDTSMGSPYSWSWDFGDGATSTDQNPTHVYESTGTYTVKE